MAITRAQQYKQMLQEGGRLGYRFGGGRDMGNQGIGGQSPGPGGPSGKGGMGGSPDKPGRDGPSRDKEDNRQQYSARQYTKPSISKQQIKDAREFQERQKQKIAQQKAIREKEERQKRIREEELKEKRSKIGFDTTTKYGTPVGPMSPRQRNIIGLEKIGLAKSAIEEDDSDDVATAKAIAEQNPLQKFLSNIKPPSVALIEGILSKIPGRSLDEMYDQYIKDKTGFKFREYAEDKGGRELFKQDVLAGKISSKGGPMGGFGRDEMGNTFGPGGDGPDNQIIPQVVPTTTGSTTTTPQVVDNRTELEKLLAARGDAFRFFADGGMADDDDPVGGIMDLESGRQMYFLGKLVKKVTRGVKKIAKSPVGKLALGAAAIKFGAPFLKSEGLKNFFFKGGEMGLKNLTQKGLLTGILGTSALAGLMTPKQEEDEEQYLGPTLDIPAIRRDPYGAMGGAYSFYAEGGKAEPVAKKTMPLLDMNGMEKDYRETGGFVEMGRMERADDVPARLSKNEFVFTADAVRNAGDGNIDKGAEVMYNMMKNLEAGGEVSEESQGLEGARKMFQTSQRLGEVV